MPTAATNAAPAPTDAGQTGRPTLLWFRKDLRLADNAALAAALARQAPVVPVFVLDEAGEGRWPLGGASKWWLHHSLAALADDLARLGAGLVLARGDSEAELARIAAATGAGAVYWNRRYEPAVRARDAVIKRRFNDAGIDARSFNSALLFEPHTIQNKQGRAFQVFTPYWRHCTALGWPEPVKSEAPTWPSWDGVAGATGATGAGRAKETTERRERPGPLAQPGPRGVELGVGLVDLGLLPTRGWAAAFPKHWTPGEAGARARLKRFLQPEVVHRYDDQRNLPDIDGTSGLSPHLRWGEIGPRQVVAAVRALGRESGLDPASNGARIYLTEIGWREFAYHLLFHFEHTPERPLREDFERFPWAKDPGGILLRAWQKGLTGYPIVDAGLRQLWATGWMHNRVRMIVASFLVKHLRLPWQHGAAWFWDTLVDADLASNTLGWQWSAGCGADAAPYFRIFAPVTQGEKFDGAGHYVRKWVPELARLPDKFLHAPWTAPASVLAAAGVALGVTYPAPLVDHATARAAALGAFKSLRGGALGAEADAAEG